MILGPVSWEYAAAFFDGEGAVTLFRRVVKENVYYGIRSLMSNTNEQIVRDFHATFGGHVAVKTPQKATHKPSWQWGVDARLCEAFLRGIQPHVRIKGPQIEIALEFFTWRNRPLAERLEIFRDGSVGRHWRKREDTLAREVDMHARMRVLNRRGTQVAVA